MSSMGRIRRRSIRLRVALTVTAAMMAALVAIAAYVYHDTAAALDRATDDSLVARLSDATSAVQREPDTRTLSQFRFVDRDSFVQIVSPDGGLLADSGERDGKLVLPQTMIRRAAAAPRVEQRVLDAHDSPARMRYQLVRVRNGEHVVVIVGASRERDIRTLRALRRGLLVGGGIATLLTALIGYMAVALSLRPVERIRREAASVTSADSGRRLPLPQSADELGRLVDTLNEMLERLDEGIQRERRLTADASHELRSPLALLKLELEIALSELAPVSDLGDARRQIGRLVETIRSSEASVDQLVQMAESLLLLARTDQDGLAIVRGETNVGNMVEDLANRYAHRAEREGRPLTVTGTDAVVSIDSLRVGQALNNLVDNAFRHGEGPVSVEARVEESGDGAELLVHVRDDGPGFDPGFAARAFERFTREDAARTTAGAGLGMSIVRAIARAHGGEVGIATTAQGADIWIRIPA